MPIDEHKARFYKVVEVAVGAGQRLLWEVAEADVGEVDHVGDVEDQDDGNQNPNEDPRSRETDEAGRLQRVAYEYIALQGDGEDQPRGQALADVHHEKCEHVHDDDGRVLQSADLPHNKHNSLHDACHEIHGVPHSQDLQQEYRIAVLAAVLRKSDVG